MKTTNYYKIQGIKKNDNKQRDNLSFKYRGKIKISRILIILSNFY